MPNGPKTLDFAGVNTILNIMGNGTLEIIGINVRGIASRHLLGATLVPNLRAVGFAFWPTITAQPDAKASAQHSHSGTHHYRPTCMGALTRQAKNQPEQTHGCRELCPLVARWTVDFQRQVLWAALGRVTSEGPVHCSCAGYLHEDLLPLSRRAAAPVRR